MLWADLSKDITELVRIVPYIQPEPNIQDAPRHEFYYSDNDRAQQHLAHERHPWRHLIDNAY